jgi:Putative auto-transporter adhesin, head GIN domain
MKKILLLLCICSSLQSFAIWKNITGNGVLKTESRNAEGYTSITSSGPFNIEIHYGTASSISIKGDENILPYIETIVKDGKLFIKVKDLVILKPKNTIQLEVSMKTINSISQSGSGSITGEGKFSNDGQANFNISGSGSIQLAFANFHETDINMSGSGKIDLKGNIASSLDITQSGSGQIDCLNTPCATVNAKMSGSGTIKINATENIDARISGSGKIYYTGKAPNINSKVSGSGKIEKI